MFLSYLTIMAVVIFAASNILLFILSAVYLDWKLARSKGVLIPLLVFGGYRHSWALEYIYKNGMGVMVLLDKFRYFSIVAVVVLLPLSFVYGLIVNA